MNVRWLRSPWVRGFAVLVLVAGAVAAIWWRGPDWGQVWHAFDFVVWRWVVVAVFINFLSVVARSVSWRLTIDQALPEPHPRYREVFSAFCVGLLGNAVLPARAGRARARGRAAPAHARPPEGRARPSSARSSRTGSSTCPRSRCSSSTCS